MNKADIVAFEYTKENGTLGLDYNQIYDAVKHGYHQAEKDLELTVEDIKKIYFLFKDVTNEWYGYEFSDYGICREVLKRFKERKENS